MASICKEALIARAPAEIWDAVRDVGALHTRLAPGFVTATQLEPGARLVTFANGMTAREQIITCDDANRRLVWSVAGGRMTHHNASLQVFAEGWGSRAVWNADLQPDELAPAIAGMIEQGLAAMKRHLEAHRRPPTPG